jgi:muconate cycloisomerase
MARISEISLVALDLPFRTPFKHAAASRNVSSSIIIKLTTDSGNTGFGECLPRSYVTGESRDSAFDMLKDIILPKLKELSFDSLDEVKEFLQKCDGKAPPEWVSPQTPQSAAWCAVDIALLDTFGHEFNEPVMLSDDKTFPENLRYSLVISSSAGFKILASVRLMGTKQVKIKLEKDNSADFLRKARRLLGSGCDIRADMNMAWNVDEALRNMPLLAELGVRSFEQPIPADDIDGLAELVRQTGLTVMVDESLTDKNSLDTLISKKACTAVNVRISKCGGIIASYNRCREALAAGMTIQVGCQVGETSLLSSAHLKLLTAVRDVTYTEGCFGRILLREDPGEPELRFKRHGINPKLPAGPGFGISMNESVIERWTTNSFSI